MSWTPTSKIDEEWGWIAVYLGTEHVTFYRDVPVDILNWSHAEPFGPRTAQVAFPQITPFEPLPSWLVGWTDLNLVHVAPNGDTRYLWEGYVASIDDGVDENEGKTVVSGIGTMYLADFYKKRPELFPSDPLDVYNLIARELDPGFRPAIRTLPVRCELPLGTGINMRPGGGWEDLLTGWVAEVLAATQSTRPPGWRPPEYDWGPRVHPLVPNQVLYGFIGNDQVGWVPAEVAVPDHLEWWNEVWETQWTIMPESVENAGTRRPVLLPKDRENTHWHVHVGQRGVRHQFSIDFTQTVTTVYGEGVDEANCRWRNAKYPNLRPSELFEVPVFDGNVITVGETTASMLEFEQVLFDRGWTSFNLNGRYDEAEVFWVEEFQRVSGIQVDGEIGPQTWAAAFQVGSNAGSVEGAYVAPLHTMAFTDPYFYDADGAITGDDPNFNRAIPRIERHETFGNRISKLEATRSAQAEIARDSSPGIVGTVVFNGVSPNKGDAFSVQDLAGHHLEMRAGENIKVFGYRHVPDAADDPLLHIAAVEHSRSGEGYQTVLQVDSKARDYMTVGAILRRERDLTDPARRKTRTYKNVSRQIEDRVAIWDCENGSGIIPRHATYERLWNVLKIPAGQVGTIVRTEFRTDTIAPFAIGIFDTPISHIDLQRFGSPLDTENYWDQFGPGLIIAWGGSEDPAGYSDPTTGVGRQSQGYPQTGVLIDNAQWYFESRLPPWLWVAIYVESPEINYIQGRLYPSNEAF